MVFGAPTVQGRQGIAVQEAYDLTGDPCANPYWEKYIKLKLTERKKREMQEIETITSLT